MFMFGYIILFDIAGVIIIPLQGRRQNTIGQTVTVCRENPQGDAWKDKVHLKYLIVIVMVTLL